MLVLSAGLIIGAATHICYLSVVCLNLVRYLDSGFD
jgi:hypothetical protein